MTRPGMPSAFQQTQAYIRWKVSKEVIEDIKARHASAVAKFLLIELAGILKPFKFRRDRQFKIDWAMGSLTLEVWDNGKRIGFWFADGTSNQSSKVTDIHWARLRPLHIALEKVLDILGDLHNDEDDIILSALNGKFIVVNHF